MVITYGSSGKMSKLQRSSSVEETFYEHMAQFLKEKDAKTVVEVGSDVQLRLAAALSPHCRKFYSVNFPEDHARMQGWYGMARDMGSATNLELLSGNAVELPNMIDHANVIVLQNVLIDGNGRDTELMWQYRRGEKPCSDDDWTNLWERFDTAEVNAYRGFLQVADHIVRFARPEPDGRFRSMLIDTLGIPLSKIQTKEILYDGTRDVWEAHFIDNS
ncbi:MAG: hypothetical protein ABIG93_04700 [archaeon]|nr:hypothetical protein [Nanoarchaeota archaeon]